VTPECWRLLARAPRVLAATLTADQAAMLLDSLPALRACVRPADALDAALLLKRLTLHYPPPQTPHTAHESAARWDDWFRFLDQESVALDLLQQACDHWALSTERFFPSPGQLLALVRQAVRLRKEALATVETFEAMTPIGRKPIGVGVDLGADDRTVMVDVGALIGGIGKAGLRREDR
jgi:hypothetical protein